MIFSAFGGMSFVGTDVGRYEALKRIHVLPGTEEAGELLDGPMSCPVPLGLPTGFVPHEAWTAFYARRLASAAFGGVEEPFPSAFPGSHLPHPDGEIYVGSLAIARFRHLLTMPHGYPSMGPLADRARLPCFTVVPLPKRPDWAWGVEQPVLREVHMHTRADCLFDYEVESFLTWFAGQVQALLQEDPISFERIFHLIRLAWAGEDPHGFTPETLELAEVATAFYRTHSLKKNWLAYFFELESLLSRIQFTRSLGIEPTGAGFYEERWLETGWLALPRLHCTELVVLERLVAEIETLHDRGFAPIVVDEHGNDTDGTHRLVAAWLNNILKATMQPGDDPFGLGFSVRLCTHVELHKDAMGPVVTHEALYALQQMLARPDLKARLERLAPAIRRADPVQRLPVVLLPEYSWVTVIKGAYDDGLGSYRVPYQVYRQLATGGRDLVLPARGPYHRTDCSLLPTIRVL